MTAPTTLLEELEENAAALEAAARYGEVMGMPSDDVLRRAAALRARAERVRELLGRLSELDKLGTVNYLTGPLPSPTRPDGGQTQT